MIGCADSFQFFLAWASVRRTRVVVQGERSTIVVEPAAGCGRCVYKVPDEEPLTLDVGEAAARFCTENLGDQHGQ